MLHRIKVPGKFVIDCLECDCDIGDYKDGWLTCTDDQLAELWDRAEYYADPNGPPLAGNLPRCAKALIKALDRYAAA